jgi:phosphoglycolate phosphatase-like HAD superfamily hydrolase
MPETILWLFDLDGTLIRTHGAGVRAMNRAFLEIMGWQEALAEISPAGLTDPIIAHRISRIKRGALADEMQRVFELYLKHLEAEMSIADYEVMPGITPFLEEQVDVPNVMLGLGTGNLEAGARLKLEPAGLNRFFPFGGFGSDARERSELLSIGVAKAGNLVGARIPAERIIVVGDTPHDINAGRAIGARTLAVATGPFSQAELMKYQPDLTIEDFTEEEAVKNFIRKIR